MSGNTDRINSILIVSGSEQFTALFQKAISKNRLIAAASVKGAAAARRRVMERNYDIVVIIAPLQEEFGHELALDLSEKGNSSVLLIVPSEVYDAVLEKVTDYGVLVLSKPFSGSIGFLLAEQRRLLRLEKRVRTLEEKMEEIRIVSKAKLLLIEKRQMSEEEAHRHIGKQAMDHGVTRRQAAEQILDDLE